jgi:glycerophosphoryl diester phosphodiesterase
LWCELRNSRLRDRHGTVTDETPMLLEELLERTPPDLPVQIEVKAHGDPELARATAAEVCRLAAEQTDGRPLELLSFHSCACEEAAREDLSARLVIWADYALGALLGWATDAGVGGVCIEHFLLHPALVQKLQAGGLSPDLA